ncbi:DNA repair protein complementing XP-C cells homolog [Phymastichus coffea]|uniref:DNA repair protein complementing XP-C cells homolog n=1 Tax=Phymastichus coffea TaxID=108790 RepID=UPI00273CC70D|nr:DNA repair protein complementing XP-C cells homolog [Phymastichus coffea]XP_058800686.1 DNA repair protein complementing XP-C cells homolog [Phymastichus coffea]
MSQLSDDESSDSSDDFFVPAEKIDLNSSFFKILPNKTNPSSPLTVQSSSDDSDDDVNNLNDNTNSAELLAQVLRNFENAKTQNLVSNNNNQSSTSTEQVTPVSYNEDLSKEINDLLLQGESQVTLSKQDDKIKTVHGGVENEAKSNYTIPEKGIQIHLPKENFMLDKKNKRQRNLQKLLQSKINQRIRAAQVFVHKVGLLTWLSHGFFLNKLANDPELLAITLSLISPNNYPKDRPDLKYIEQFTEWFTGRFSVFEKHREVFFNIDTLLQRVSDKKVYNYIELVLLYIAAVRGMGINCRLVLSLQPPRLKPKQDELLKIHDNDSKTTLTRNTSSKNSSKRCTKNNKSKSEEKSISPTKIIPENSREFAKLEARNRAAAIFNKSIVADDPKKDNVDTKDSNILDNEDNVSIAKKISLKAFKRIQTKKKLPSISSNSKQNVSNIDKTDKTSEEKNKNSENDSNFSDDESEFSTDDDYVEKKPKKRILDPIQKNPPSTSKVITKKYNHRKLLSSDEEDVNNFNNSYNVWVEVYLESEESWISVDILDKKIHCNAELYKKASIPVLYVVAWNSIGTLKDVTRRYCPHWLTDTRKKRVDDKWWTETLSNWKEKRTAMSRAEDQQLLQRELEQPLPKTVGECKGHPLYVLTRHLLKFEALHPPDVVPLGFLKTGEAIYSRHCVHTLCSRETWIKKARVVKPGEQAYKVVKAMPKFDKLSGQKIKDQPLELFGKWQTFAYVPPEAKNGTVPRNEYGNVDLFKMCMLPKGTVYINLPGLNRIARKLNIDCAQACVGFNFGCRGALPAFEGYVVCEEYEDTLREAWEEEQIEAQKRAKEKREKRIYGNWKKLIKGLIIRERLAAKYNFKDEEIDTNSSHKKQTTNTKKNSVPEKKPVKVVAKNGKDYNNDLKIKKPSNVKSRAITNKILSDDEYEEKEEINNKKLESIRNNFSRKATTKKINKNKSNNDSNKKSSGSDMKIDATLNFENNDGIRMTRKRAAAAKNLIDVNHDKGGSEDEFQETTGVAKRKLVEKKDAIASKLSKRSKIEQDNTSKKSKKDKT